MIKVILKKGEEKRILNGESIIYANEVLKVIKDNESKNGSLVSVYTYDDKFIGKGYINYLSKVLVRLLSRDKDMVDDYDFFLNRIKDANDFRIKLSFNNAYRVVFSESDRLPGLIVDKYDNVLVIEISSLGIDLKRDIIIKALVEIFNPKGIYEKCEMNLREKEGLKNSKGLIYGDVDSEVIIEENGLKLSVDVINGQKTGYFLDQKENRMSLRKYTDGANVLDCFSNTGGFSINAALNAKEVISVDISKTATDNVLRNAELNNLKNIKVITDDVFKVLRNFKTNNQKFDCIILDPPAFTKSVSEVKDALRGYKDINILAMKILNDGGILVTSSCSHYVDRNSFEKMLIEAGINANKRLRVIERRGQSRDHSSLLLSNDNEYLKFFVVEVNNMY